MTNEEIWNNDTPVSDIEDFLTVPDWIDEDITPATIAAIYEGGCASGAYMPAVTYYEANRVMGEHGDNVLWFIEQYGDELPAPPAGESWSGIAVFYLSCAVELWANEAYYNLELLDTEVSA